VDLHRSRKRAARPWSTVGYGSHLPQPDRPDRPVPVLSVAHGPSGQKWVKTGPPPRLNTPPCRTRLRRLGLGDRKKQALRRGGIQLCSCPVPVMVRVVALVSGGNGLEADHLPE